MSTSTSKAKPQTSRWEYRFYSILLLPLLMIGALASRIFGRTLCKRYTDDRSIGRNMFSETVSALNGSVWWSFMGR